MDNNTDWGKYSDDIEAAKNNNMTYKEYVGWKMFFKNKRADNPKSQELARQDFQNFLYRHKTWYH